MVSSDVAWGILLSIAWYEAKAHLKIEIPGWLDLTVNELCIAFIIAALVGGIFEWWLQREAINDIVKAGLGYMLPEPIKSEMAWIYGLNLIRTNYHLKFTIEPAVTTGLVRLRQSLRYDLQNRSGSSTEAPVLISVDEWFHTPLHSDITGVGYFRDGKRRDFTALELGRRISSNGWAITFSDDSIELQPGETMTVWCETTQYRYATDRETLVLVGPVENPEIEVVLPDNLRFDIGVQHREKVINTGPNVYRLQGTLLPYQSISLRWWPKAQDTNNSTAMSGK